MLLVLRVLQAPERARVLGLDAPRQGGGLCGQRRRALIDVQRVLQVLLAHDG